MAGVPPGVSLARLVGGALDGTAVEVEPGREIIEMSPMVTFGGPADELDRVRGSVWVYRYVRVDEGPDGPAAVFEFEERRETA